MSKILWDMNSVKAGAGGHLSNGVITPAVMSSDRLNQPANESVWPDTYRKQQPYMTLTEAVLHDLS